VRTVTLLLCIWQFIVQIRPCPVRLVYSSQWLVEIAPCFSIGVVGCHSVYREDGWCCLFWSTTLPRHTVQYRDWKLRIMQFFSLWLFIVTTRLCVVACLRDQHPLFVARWCATIYPTWKYRLRNARR
jgi:hypothetical protein